MSYISYGLVFLLVLTPAMTVSVSNLDAACLKCICIASTGCNENFGCSAEGFCGPYFISRKYWEHAVDPTFSSIISTPKIGYEDCVRDEQCAAKVVTKYMAAAGWDCNNDGVTDCDDYANIHFYGPDNCDKTNKNSLFHSRYLSCRPSKPDEFSLLRR